MTTSVTSQRLPIIICALLALVTSLLVALPGVAVAQASPADLFFSEYVEGSSNNKAIEIYNGTGAAVDLAAGGYAVELYSNGSTTAASTQALTGTVADGDVFILANGSAGAEIMAAADITSTAANFNGNDALVLRSSAGVVDSFGQVGTDPGTEWPGGGLNDTLRRQATVCDGDTDQTDAFDASTEYDTFAQDTFDGLGSHTVSCGPGSTQLLLSEVVITPTDDEFIEIYNPGPSTLALDDVYLTDATFAGGSTYYYNVTTGTNAGGGAFADFHARFPAGSAIAAGAFQTVALTGSTNFETAYGLAPDYELFEDDVTADGVPDMREALPGAINDQGGLTNGGEVAVLYSWDGASDLVTDLDYVLWGDTDEAVDKTGVSVDGPDADAVASPYLNDTAIASQAIITDAGHSEGQSFGRIDDDEGAETKTGGNGAGGHDETSEDLDNTWAVRPVSPGAATSNEPPVLICTDATDLISTIQGSGPIAACNGEDVTVSAVVTSLFEDDDIVEGFFAQEEDADADADAATSEGIFVFCDANCPAGLAVGDAVDLDAGVTEFFGMTQLVATTAGDVTVTSSGNPLPTATALTLPAAGATTAEATFESVEGMVVSFPDTLVVSEYFNLARFGEIVLTETSRPNQYTHDNSPDVAGYQTFLDDLATRRIALDDNNNDQNDAISGAADEPYPFPSASWPDGGLSLDTPVRGGQTIDGLTGVMHWSFPGSGDNTWRIRPIDGESYTFTDAVPRQDAPEEVGGDLTVATFNVLNYFPTVDVTSSGTMGDCGPTGTLDCRGADSQIELDRQRAKIVAALATIDADVVGLIEIENADGAVQDLVDQLNAEVGAGTYAQLDTGTIGSDAIRVGFIYKPATVTPVGDFEILDETVDARFIDTKNRPMLVQTFTEVASGEVFTAAVNHLKSKGSDCADIGEDESIIDGQANCSETRNDAAAAIADFLAADPTGSGDPDVLILGDLNAYRNEDAIVTLETAGYVDLAETLIGDDAYTYLFDGQVGYLDYALANDTLAEQVSGVTAWHINADEAPLLDYNDAIEDVGEVSFERKSDALPLYAPDAFRSSDHDPVIIGLSLGEDPLDPDPTDPDPTDPTDPDPVDPDPSDGVVNLLPEDPANTDNTALSVLGSQLLNPDGALAGTDTEVLIASDTVFPDALASGSLQVDGTPLLLNAADSLEPEVSAELQRLGAGAVRILGGTVAIGQAVEDALTAAGFTVSRTAGPTRIETASEIVTLALAAAAEADSPSDTAILARAYPTSTEDATQAFADALAVGGFVADDGTGVLLTQPDVLTGSTNAYLQGSDITSTTVIGGPDAVADSVLAQLDSIGVTSDRITGPNRFATAVAVAAERGFDADSPAERLIVLEGQGGNAWAAGFTLAGLSAMIDAPIVLVNGDDVPVETQSFLDTAFAPAADGIVIVCASNQAACEAVAAQLDG